MKLIIKQIYSTMNIYYISMSCQNQNKFKQHLYSLFYFLYGLKKNIYLKKKIVKSQKFYNIIK